MTKNINKQEILETINFLRKTTENFPKTMTESVIDIYGCDPFLVLMSCLLSLRTRDIITFEVSQKLFKIAKTPQELSAIPIEQLESIVYKTGFYKKKAQVLHYVSQELLKKFNGQVPNNQKDLMAIKGIGIKTANLVLCMAFSIPAICVDTHVHRIANQLGWVHTKRPEQTEQELKKIIPQELWCEINTLLVKWGQNRPKTNIVHAMARNNSSIDT